MSLTRSSRKFPVTGPQEDKGRGQRRAYGWKRENLNAWLRDAKMKALADRSLALASHKPSKPNWNTSLCHCILDSYVEKITYCYKLMLSKMVATNHIWPLNM